MNLFLSSRTLRNEWRPCSKSPELYFHGLQGVMFISNNTQTVIEIIPSSMIIPYIGSIINEESY